MSPLLQEIFCYVGQLNVYEKSTAILEKLLGITTSNMQVNKVTNFYGNLCSKGEALLKPVLKDIKKSEHVYVEADGSMLFTRDGGWKEVKVGRIFKSSDCISPEGKPSYIKHSQYYAHLGDSKTFTCQMDTLLDRYNVSPEQLIFISDGALWIKNWIEDAFPKAISMLDYYHAKEHLYQFIEVSFIDKAAGKNWGEQQSNLLLESKVEEVMKNIESISVQLNKKAGDSLIANYESNKNRMDYKRYRQIGTCIIGSGAIESAHRTLVQNRMKLSGQRWSLSGAQNMLNMKTVYLNEKWENVIEMTKTKAA
jgi:hypothetical protein